MNKERRLPENCKSVKLKTDYSAADIRRECNNQLKQGFLYLGYIIKDDITYLTFVASQSLIQRIPVHYEVVRLKKDYSAGDIKRECNNQLKQGYLLYVDYLIKDGFTYAIFVASQSVNQPLPVHYEVVRLKKDFSAADIKRECNNQLKQGDLLYVGYLIKDGFTYAIFVASQSVNQLLPLHYEVVKLEQYYASSTDIQSECNALIEKGYLHVGYLIKHGFTYSIYAKF